MTQLYDRYEELREAARQVCEATPVLGQPDELKEALGMLSLFTGMTDSCRECGCTEEYACESGCYWVEANLCSSCEATQWTWGIVEVFGHQVYAGRIREVPLVADEVGLQVACPDIEVEPHVTKAGLVPGYTGRGFDKTFSPKAVFSIELVSEDIARARAWSLGHYERQRPAAQPRPPIQAGMVVIPSFDPEGAAAVVRVEGDVLLFGDVRHGTEWTYSADDTLAIYSAAGELLWGLGPDAPPDRQPCFDIPF